MATKSGSQIGCRDLAVGSPELVGSLELSLQLELLEKGPKPACLFFLHKLLKGSGPGRNPEKIMRENAVSAASHPRARDPVARPVAGIINACPRP